MTGIDAVNKVTNNHTLLQKPPLPPENFFYIIKPHQISGRQSIKMIDLTLCTSLVPLLTGVWYHFRPGPKELPIVGNLLDIPRERSCRLTYADWACTLGDVLYIILKQKRSSLRNDRRIIANYAGRPPLVGFRFAYIMSAFHMAHMPYSDRC